MTKSKTELREKYGITEQEEKEYPLPNEEDYQILSLVKILGEKDLSESDTEMVEIIRTQLLDDWREPLLVKLKALLQKYS